MVATYRLQRDKDMAMRFVCRKPRLAGVGGNGTGRLYHGWQVLRGVCPSEKGEENVMRK